MPRNSSGVYTLPASNPVVPFTTIATSWANPTMSDIGAELTNSLDRTGRGGMLAPFRIFDGTVIQPGLAFANEAGLGLWRSTTGTMHLASVGANVLTVEPGMASSPVKMAFYGVTQFRNTGMNWWQTKIESDSALSFTPSTAVNGETFDVTKQIKMGITGGLSAPGHVTVGGGVAVGGVLPASTGEFRGNSFVTPASGYIGLNTDYVGGATGWAFMSNSGFAALIQITGTNLTNYISSAASTVAGAAVGLITSSVVTPKGTGFGTGIGIGTANPPRAYDAGSGAPYVIDMNGSGVQVALFGTSNVGLKYSFGFDSNIYCDFGPLLPSGALNPIASSTALIIRQTRSNTFLDQALVLFPSGLVQVGNNANTIPGAIASTWKNLGSGTFTPDFRQYQTAIVGPGSTIAGWTAAEGQVFRIFVNGGGAIAMPATGGGVKYAIGSPGNFGTTGTLISIALINSVNYITFIPF